jgi:predicted DNA-binding protein (MmcQ/YjbR family)
MQINVAGILQKLSAICMALPNVEMGAMGDHTTFRVGKKPFAYFLNSHHGDGIVSVCVKAIEGENVDRARLDPHRFYVPAYIGVHGWFGLRLDQGNIDWNEVRELVERSYGYASAKSSRKPVAQAAAKRPQKNRK